MDLKLKLFKIFYGGFNMSDKNKKCSDSQKGRIVIHLNDEEKRIYPNELPIYEQLGWVKGITEKHKKENSKKRKGKQSHNKGKHLTEQTKKKISDSLIGNIPWNKGLTAITDDRVKSYTLKGTQTKINRYGCAFPNNNMTDTHKKAIGDANRGKTPRKLTAEELEHKTSQQYNTRKKNHTFNTSNPENDYYKFLLKNNPGKTIYRNYKCDRYPFYCDFYIVEDDLFIELNLHWTHGGMPYDENNEDCIKKLNEWIEKSKVSNFYKNAIETWTIRDVKKLQQAKENNLNYKSIYNIQE